MTLSLLQRPDPVDLLATDRRRAALTVAVVAGVCLGIVDLLLQVTLPYPWANLANSSAMWALVAFAYGVWWRRPGLRVGVGGALLLVVAVVSYYAAAALTRGDDWANVWAPSSLLRAVFGVLAGVVFGLLGAVARAPGWPGVVAAAAAGAVCFAESVVALVRFDAYVGPGDPDLIRTAFLTAGIGLAVLVVAARTVPAIGRAMLLSVPLAAVAFGGFAAAGFVPLGA